MYGLWAFNIRYEMNDFSVINQLVSVMAANKTDAKKLVMETGTKHAKDRYPNLTIRKIISLDSIDIKVEDFLFAGDIIDKSFKEKIDWAERDIVKGITEGKPLRQSISMVLCAVSEDAYNRGRSYERDKV